MTFLNPLYLLALSAAAIPILLHLLNLRRVRVVEFSTLAFLKELQRSRIRRLKLKQWLLLLLRTLVIVFVVLAFTRPALRSAMGFLPGTTAANSVVIVLDDSYSMQWTDQGGRRLAQARARALAVCNLLSPCDEVALIRTSGARRPVAFTSSLAAVRRDIAATTSTYTRADLHDALTAASSLLERAGNVNRELYVITDLQRASFLAGEPSTVPRAPAALLQREQRAMFPRDTRAYLLSVGDEQTLPNACVSDLRFTSSIFEKNRLTDLTATIASGSDALSGTAVSLFVDGERMAQTTVDVPAGGSAEARFSFAPRRSGALGGWVEIEDDRLPEDNRRYFSFSVPAEIRMLVGTAGKQESMITRLALDPAPGVADSASSAASPFAIVTSDRAALASATLQRSDIVLLLGADGLPESFVSRLVPWVRAGGALILFPDAEVSPAPFNALLRRFRIPEIGGVYGIPGATAAHTTLGHIDFQSPFLRGVFTLRPDGGDPRVESPRIACCMRLRADAQSRVVAQTAGGDAFLLEKPFERGTVLVFAVSPALTWSDLPLKGLFVPLLHRAVLYGARHADDGQEAFVGRPFEVQLPPGTAPAAYVDVVGARGVLRRVTPRVLPAGSVVPLDGIEEPGVFVLRSSGEELRSIAVNTDPAEGDLRIASPEERREFFRSMGIEAVSSVARENDLKAAVSETRYGVELWKYMLACALLCAVAEMFVARDARRDLGDEQTVDGGAS